jgi:hypothetical protein
MNITNTEIFLLCALGIAIAYALRVKDERDRLMFVMRAIVADEAKYKILRDEHIAARKELDSKRV